MSSQSTTLKFEWRNIPGLEGYQASSYGHIRTCWNSRKGNKFPKITDKWQMVKIWDSNGYLRFDPVKIGKVRRRYSVHRAVCLAFHGQPPSSDMEVAHFPDKDKHNNRIDNLSWKTVKENQAHRIIHGTDVRGVKCYSAKITEDNVYMIRALRGLLSQSKIGKIFGLQQTQIRRIQRRERWKHLKEKKVCPSLIAELLKFK